MIQNYNTENIKLRYLYYNCLLLGLQCFYLCFFSLRTSSIFDIPFPFEIDSNKCYINYRCLEDWNGSLFPHGAMACSFLLYVTICRPLLMKYEMLRHKKILCRCLHLKIFSFQGKDRKKEYPAYYPYGVDVFLSPCKIEHIAQLWTFL